MITRLRKNGALLLSLLSCSLLLAALFASDGFFNLDEVIYFAALAALETSGHFAISNGFEEFGSDDLRLWFFVNGPNGLVPQYPVGSALIGAPLLSAFGSKTLIAVNLIAGVGTLFATHAVTRQLFGSVRAANISVLILALSTFWGEYVFAHWPHSASVFFVVLSLHLFLIALDDDASHWSHAMASGLMVGVGMSFRLEGILILPAIAAMTILYAQRPVQVLIAGAAGLMPMLFVLAWFNKQKFGTWNPISYGSAEGGTDPQNYAIFGVIVFVAMVSLIVLRLSAQRRTLLSAVMGAGLIGTVATFVPTQMIDLIAGIRDLLIDATKIQDPRPGIQPLSDGTMLFWGYPKKALGQSLPWIGALTFLIRANHSLPRRSLRILLIVVFMWMLPFFMRSWHGGLGQNMRYFLPVLPLLAALAGAMLDDLIKNAGFRPMVCGCLGGLAVATGWLLLSTHPIGQFHQILSLQILIGISILSTASGLVSNRQGAIRVVLAITGFGLSFATYLAALDIRTSQISRIKNAQHSKLLEGVPGRVIFYIAPERASNALFSPYKLLALPDHHTNLPDQDLFPTACAAGYQIVTESGYSRHYPAIFGETIPLQTSGALTQLNLVKLDCAAAVFTQQEH